MPSNTEIRSGEIDEILGKAPNSLVRVGISVFFGVILLIIFGSWFFKYPDIINANIEITGHRPPAEIKARVSGKIDTFFVDNNQNVIENQILGLIENPAEYAEVLLLKQYIDSLLVLRKSNQGNNIRLISEYEGKLGELQPFYSSMIASQSAFYSFIEIAYHQHKIAAARLQLNDYKVLYNVSFDQRSTLEKDFQLASKDYNRYVKLFEDKVIPEQELEKAQSNYLSRKLAFENSRSSLANIQLQMSQLKSTITDLELQYGQQYENLLSSMIETENNLKAQIEIWEQRYLLRSPQAGKCVFTKYWAKDQNLTANETVITVLPENQGEIIGTMLLPAIGAGKVKVGQKVNIRLDNYPYMEFGMLEGRIANISDIPDQGMYYATVVFPDGLITSYGKALVFTQRLNGTAEIITNDIRLLQRILQPLKHILFERT
jgi:HlyD family secretion protein